MSDTGATYPGTVTTESANPEDDKDWTNPNNIKADDGADATSSNVAATSYSYRLKGSNFGFAVPAEATILGIVVEMERSRGTYATITEYRVQLLDAAGALVGNNKADTVTGWTTTPTKITYGSAVYTWGASPTPAMVNDADFGIAVSTKMVNATYYVYSYIDYVRMTVYYTVAVEYTRTGATAIGLLGSSSRTLELTRSGAATLGLLATAEKVRDFVGSCAIGLAASASRSLELSRLGSTALGLGGTGSRAIELVRSGSVAVGLSAVGSRVVERIKTGATAMGLVATGQRSLELSRTGTAVVGLAASSKLLTVRAARRVLKALRTLGVLREQPSER